MSARTIPLGAFVFLVVVFALTTMWTVNVTSSKVGWAMLTSFALGVGATLCGCISLLAEPRVEKKHTPPQL